jgi:hypothetical protein
MWQKYSATALPSKNNNVPLAFDPDNWKTICADRPLELCLHTKLGEQPSKQITNGN